MSELLWILGIAFVVIILQILNRPFGGSPLVELCSSTAEAFGTTFKLENRRLQFEYQCRDASVIVSFRRCERRTRQFFLEVRIRGRQPSLRCEIYPDGGRGDDRSFLGMQDADIGVKEFDRRYVVKTEDISLTKELLPRTVRQIIDDMRAATDIRDVYVSLDHMQLTASKRMDQSNRHQALQFIAKSVLLYDGIVEAASNIPSPIVSIVMAAPLETACQICGEPLQRKLVRCRSCRTLHHQDCWEYYGACSTYGCLQKRFVVVKPSVPADSKTAVAGEQSRRPSRARRVKPRRPAKRQRGRSQRETTTSPDRNQSNGPNDSPQLTGSRREREREASRRRHQRRRQRNEERPDLASRAPSNFARELGRKFGRRRRSISALFIIAVIIIYLAFYVKSLSPPPTKPPQIKPRQTQPSKGIRWPG